MSIPVGLILCVLLLLGGCSQPQTDVGSGKKRSSTHLVETLPIVPEAVSLRRERTGSLKIRRQVRIHSQEEGRITELPLFEGDPVRQGQLLAALDDRLLRAELAKSEATLRQAVQDAGRIEKLVTQRVASDDTLMKARTLVEVAAAERQLLHTRLAHTRIEAPFDGIISQRLIEPGDIAARHHHLLTLIDPESLIAEVQVSELLLPYLSQGDAVEIRIDALAGQTHSGHILRIHPQVDALSRQAPVEASFDQIPPLARAGQLVRVVFTTPAIERLMIPFSALQRDHQGEFVYCLDQGKARKTRVISAARIGERVAIRQGLEPDSLIITRGFMGLNDGKTVEPVGPADETLRK
jgi:RND family efflux transporter MFP subunit